MEISRYITQNNQNHICTLTLNQPDSLNVLSANMLHALIQTLEEIAHDDHIRVIILAANGPAFCAGHDLKEMKAHINIEYQRSLFELCSDLMMRIIRMPQPIIAKVNGIATAAGCQLVAMCDLAVASKQAKFAVSGINVGLFCATPAVALTRNIGRKQAFEMLVTGDFIDAEKAEKWGLINHAVAADELEETTLNLAQKIAAKAPLAIRYGKGLFYGQLEYGFQVAYQQAAEIMANNMMTQDTLEGINAFFEKRQPTWQGK